MQNYNITAAVLKKLNQTDEAEEEKEETQETTKTSSIKNKTLNEILSDLDDIENKYSSNDYVDAPEELELSTIEVPNKTEEDLLKIAQNSLEQKYKTNKENTATSFETKINNILNKQEEYKKEADESKKSINETYDEVVTETENQALKRGLARSSIIINQLSEINKSKASDLLSVMNNLQTSISDSYNEITKLEEERDAALNNLDISYAIELEEKLNDVKSDYEQSVQEAIKFNNNVEKLKAEYKLDLNKQKLDKLESVTKLEKEYKIDYSTEKIKEAQYDYLKEYFSSLDKDYAINLFLTNKELPSVLGDNYSKMYNYLKNR